MAKRNENSLRRLDASGKRSLRRIMVAASRSPVSITPDGAFRVPHGGHGPVSGLGSLLETQVERALSEAVAATSRSRSTSPFRGGNGAVTMSAGSGPRPAELGPMSLYSRNGLPGEAPNGDGAGTAGLAGELPQPQAVLYRQARLVAQDAIRVLQGVRISTSTVDAHEVAALRAIIETEIEGIVAECGRPARPREQRVEAYFDALLGPQRDAGHLAELDRCTRADLSTAFTSAAEESLRAGFKVLRRHADSLLRLWNQYLDDRKGPMPIGERLAEAAKVLPIVAAINDNLVQRMDELGFTLEERGSAAGALPRLIGADADPGDDAPPSTVADLNDWLSWYATREGPRAIDQGREYGLDLVTDQSHKLAMLTGELLAETAGPGWIVSPALGQVLADDRINRELRDLQSQLGTLANLALTA